MAEQYTPNLGHTPPEDSRRDAIHVAVAPVIAGHSLPPGYHVGVMSDGCFGDVDVKVGIVDPFRETWVSPGERFWLLLYPGTITGLRHVWTHPAFKTKPPEAKHAP